MRWKGVLYPMFIEATLDIQIYQVKKVNAF